MEHQPASTMIEVLTPIWQRVLRRSPSTSRIIFLSWAAIPSSAARAIQRNRAGVRPGTATRDDLSGAYDRGSGCSVGAARLRRAFHRSCCLKPGTEEPPVFLTHGLGGSVMDFFQVGEAHRKRHVQSTGCRRRDVDGVDEPFERIEDMAQFYLDAIQGGATPRALPLRRLLSRRFGDARNGAALVAETARRVALLAMLDAYPHIRYLSLGQRLRLMMRLVKRHASAAMQLPMRRRFRT